MTRYQLIFIFISCNLLLLFLHQTASETTSYNSCPHLFKTLQDCSCAHPNTISCSRSNSLTHLPRSWASTNHNLTSFTEAIHRIDLLSSPFLTTLKTDDFQGLPNLRSITIIDTSLTTIRAHAFRHLSHLHELRIESNHQLTELNTYALSYIERVHRISLISNSIRIIHAEAFRYTHFVEIIDLSDNPLEIIESYAFHGLKSVGSLILCLLPTCPIKQIDPNAFFGLNTCDTIELTGIHTTLRSHSFAHMTSIRLLNLSHSDILHIHSYAFNHSEHIGIVDLSSSMISNLDSNAFDHLSNISLLDLSGNLIRFLDKSIFQQLIHSIKQINLDNNPIQCDCSMEWYLEQRSERFKLPDVCTGPIGYECLSPNELQQSQLPCYLLQESNNETKRKLLCEHREKITSFNSSFAASMYRLHLFLVLSLNQLFRTN